MILAKGDDLDALQNRLSEDPFQQSGVAKVDIIPLKQRWPALTAGSPVVR